MPERDMEEKEMRIEKKGFTLNLEGTWMEISNAYGVLEHGDVAVCQEDIPETFAEQKLDRFIRDHEVKLPGMNGCVKRVALDKEKNEYIQLQAVRWSNDEYMLQIFDKDLVFMKEDLTGCSHSYEVADWMHAHYDVQAGLDAYVYRHGLGDCTNGGISSTRNRLCILDNDVCVHEPEDIRECVYVDDKFMEQGYTCVKPIYHKDKWFMAGGNFLYTSDSRFRDVTGAMMHPISIHDRCEG